jgi:hypothetical protein
MTFRLTTGGICYLALVVVEIIDAIDWGEIVTFHRGVLLYNPPGFTHARLNYFFRDMFMNAAAVLTALSFAAALLSKKKGGSSTSATAASRKLGSSSKSDGDGVGNESQTSKTTDEEESV